MPDRTTLIKWAAITAPILIGLTIRLVGIEHGKPDMVYHPDVAKQTLVARHVYHGDLDIRQLFKDDFTRTLYPYGTAVMLGNIAKLGGDKMDDVHRWRWALRMRYLSVALIAGATLVLLLVLSRELKHWQVFLIGTALLTEPLNSQFSHYGMNDVPLLAFLLVALAGSILMPREKKYPIWSLLAGMSAGIGFAVKYQGLLALAFPGMMWLWLLKSRPIRQTCFSALAVSVGFFAGALPFCPMLTSDPGYFFSTFPEFMDWQANIMGLDRSLSSKLALNLGAFREIFIARGFLMLLPMAIIAAAAAWPKRKTPEVAAPVSACLLVSFLLLAAILLSRDLVRQNDMIPILALLLIPAGITLPHMRPASTRAAIFLFAVFTAISTFISSLDAAALRREDTRRLARDWCSSNLPKNAIVAYERYTLPPTGEQMTLKRAKFIGNEQSRHLINEADILIVSSLAYQRFFDPNSPYFDKEVQQSYDRLAAEFEELKAFSDRQLLYAQPTITIFKRRTMN